LRHLPARLPRWWWWWRPGVPPSHIMDNSQLRLRSVPAAGGPPSAANSQRRLRSVLRLYDDAATTLREREQERDDLLFERDQAVVLKPRIEHAIQRAAEQEVAEGSKQPLLSIIRRMRLSGDNTNAKRRCPPPNLSSSSRTLSSAS